MNYVAAVLLLVGAVLAVGPPAHASTIECASNDPDFDPQFGSTPPSSLVYLCQQTKGTATLDDDCFFYGLQLGFPVEGRYCR